MTSKYIYAKLTANAAITALCGTRIYPVGAPFETRTPYITYRTINIIPKTYSKEGPSPKDDYLVEFNIFNAADKPKEALEDIETLFEEIRQTFDFVASTAGGVTVEHCEYMPSGGDSIDDTTGHIFKNAQYTFRVVR